MTDGLTMSPIELSWTAKNENQNIYLRQQELSVTNLALDKKAPNI